MCYLPHAVHCPCSDTSYRLTCALNPVGLDRVPSVVADVAAGWDHIAYVVVPARTDGTALLAVTGAAAVVGPLPSDRVRVARIAHVQFPVPVVVVAGDRGRAARP